MDKLDFSKPDQLQTRNGRQVRIYATDGGGSHCIHGAILFDNGWMNEHWMENGNYHNSVCESPYDIVPKPARVTGWVNVYEGCLGTNAHAKKEDANANRVPGSSYIGQIYIDAEVQE